MTKPFQREGSISNAHVGKEFELLAQKYFKKADINLKRNHKIPLGFRNKKKDHAFDLGCDDSKILVECKSHRWTSSDNVPSAKMTVWNEAMYYFSMAPKNYRKIMFVLYDMSQKRSETLAEYYIRTNDHLIPTDVEFMEYNNGKVKQLK